MRKKSLNENEIWEQELLKELVELQLVKLYLDHCSAQLCFGKGTAILETNKHWSCGFSLQSRH